MHYIDIKLFVQTNSFISISQIVPMRALVVVEAVEGDLLGKLANLRLKLAHGAAGVIAFQE